MTNETLGHMIRGRFCSAIASLLLDGVKLQRLGGLVQYDVWKIVNSFIQEGNKYMICLLLFSFVPLSPHLLDFKTLSIHPFSHLFIHSVVYSSIQSFIHPFSHLFIHSVIYSSILQ